MQSDILNIDELNNQSNYKHIEEKQDDIKDIYFFAYNLLVNSLKKENLEEAMISIIDAIKKVSNCNSVLLFKKDELNHYEYHIDSEGLTDVEEHVINSFVNKAKNIIEKNKIYDFNYRVSDNISSLSFIPIHLGEADYILSLTNFKYEKNQRNIEYFNVLSDTITLVLREKELVDRLNQTSTVDSLTNLYNRNIYEKDAIGFNNPNELCYGIFDLFRLKFINDNYGHAYGDLYIKKTAEVLKNYFPEYTITFNQDGTNTKEHTGNYLYRIGGDEFVLITTNENLKMVQAKAEMIKEEIRMLDLGLDDKPLVGINYGISERKNNESIAALYESADALLRQDKSKTYVDLGLDRRR